MKAAFLASFIFGLPPALVLLRRRSNDGSIVRWLGANVDRRTSEVTRSPAKIELPGPPELGPPDSYFYGVWIDATEDEPREYYDELDADRWSIRCVRKYRDGRFEA